MKLPKFQRRTIKKIENKIKRLDAAKISKYLKKVEGYYRKLDPANYLYVELILKNINKKINKRTISQIYTTLIAWNMDMRGAKLSKFETFYNSICESDNKKQLIELRKYKLNQFKSSEDYIKTINDVCLDGKLFKKLKLVKQGKPKLVTFSKTLHFIAPNFILPIDRDKTFGFFQLYFKKKQQYELFLFIHKKSFEIYKKFKSFLIRNRKIYKVPVTKLIDNIYVGKRGKGMKSN